MKIISTLAFLPVVAFGCATVSPIPEGAEPLTNEEITETFSGVRESYRGKDIPGMKATGIFNANGKFEASWSVGSQSGVANGEWYSENGKRCLRDKNPNGDTNLECVEFFRTGDSYTSVNEDGSIHGFHTLTPLE